MKKKTTSGPNFQMGRLGCLRPTYDAGGPQRIYDYCVQTVEPFYWHIFHFPVICPTVAQIVLTAGAFGDDKYLMGTQSRSLLFTDK